MITHQILESKQKKHRSRERRKGTYQTNTLLLRHNHAGTGAVREDIASDRVLLEGAVRLQRWLRKVGKRAGWLWRFDHIASISVISGCQGSCCYRCVGDECLSGEVLERGISSQEGAATHEAPTRAAIVEIKVKACILANVIAIELLL